MNQYGLSLKKLLGLEPWLITLVRQAEVATVSARTQSRAKEEATREHLARGLPSLGLVGKTQPCPAQMQTRTCRLTQLMEPVFTQDARGSGRATRFSKRK